jgi:hypothetical protein
MKNELIIEEVKTHIKVLCTDIFSRRVGGEGNRRATAYVKEKFRQSGSRTGIAL